MKSVGLALPGVLTALVLPQADGLAAHSVSPVVLYHGSRNFSVVAMTFDDCYDLELLQKWASFLEQYPDQHVTFFPVGIALENAAIKKPDLWKNLIAQGHEIGYHSYSHSIPSTLSGSEFLEDYKKWYSAATKAVGVEPKVRFARPPYGELSFSFLNMCSRNKLKAAMWTDSWGMADVYFEKEKELSQKGDIILFHIRFQDVENAKIALPYFLGRSLSPVTLSELYELDQQLEEYIPPCIPGQRKACAR